MKKKLFFTVVAVLVLCLTCGMLLVACNKNGDGNTPSTDEKYETWSESASTMLKEVYNKIAADISVGDGADKGKNFVVDFDIVVDIDDKTADNDDKAFRFILKADVDVRSGEESTFIIQLSDYAVPAEEKVIFGFAYDGTIDPDAFYFNYGDAEVGYCRIVGNPLTKFVEDICTRIDSDKDDEEEQPSVDEEENTSEEEDMLQDILNSIKEDPSSIFGILEEMTDFYSEGEMQDYGNVYYVPLDLRNGIKSISDFLSMIPETYRTPITSVLNTLLGTDYEDTYSGTTLITSGLTQAVNHIADTYLKGIDVALRFEFDDNDAFKSGEIIIDHTDPNKQYADIGTYTVSVNKAVVNVTTPSLDLADYGVDVDPEAPAINFVNFTLDATVNSYTKGEGDNPDAIKDAYVIDIDVDLNPVVLVGLINDSSSENVEKVLSQLGRFSITLTKKGATEAEDIELVSIKTINDEADGTIDKVSVVIKSSKTGGNVISTEKNVKEIMDAVENLYNQIKNMVSAPAASGETNTTPSNDNKESIGAIAKKFLDTVASGEGYLDINVNALLDLAKEYDPNHSGTYEALKIDGDYIRIALDGITLAYGNAFEA